MNDLDLATLTIIAGAMLAGAIIGLSLGAICRRISDRRTAIARARTAWLSATIVLPRRIRGLNRLQ